MANEKTSRKGIKRGNPKPSPAASETLDRAHVEKALRESENRFRQSVENSPNPIFSVSRTGAIQIWNQSCAKIFGFGPEIAGQHYYILMPSDASREKIDSLLVDVFEHGRSFSEVEITYQCRDNHLRFMFSRLYPLLDLDGRVVDCVFANTDITARKKAEEEIYQRTRQWEALRQMGMELAAELELETLLASIAR
ncbi:MAG: PAS domain S-box protein, partial [Chloroflexota bacterium]